ncbi:MAG: hypothetical protein IIB40_04060 [Candidatus Marinimicrobia bacterium]|nr:hypothetical protein [Candidatus Neomarinimicrobiota bacterium]
MTTGPKRKLVAIMFIDMVGYTSLMQSDEEKARNLVQKQRDLLKPLVEKHDGTVLQYVGDGTFCMFNSAIEAVNAAMEIQRSVSSEKDLMLRIGIHIGDVVKDGDEIYGDGVNIASRLEPLAPPGGVCITGEVASSIRNQAGITFKSIGEQYLKNVDHPLEVFALTGKGLVVPELQKVQSSSAPSPTAETTGQEAPKSKRSLFSSVGAVVAVALIWFIFQLFYNSGVTEVTADENSLAVLVIDNLSEPEDPQKLTEMIKELLITDLSQSKTLRIVGSQRLYDLAKQYGSGDGSLINRDNASKIAREARAQWMLTGRLAILGEKMVLTTQIENVKDGKILDAQRADGTDLFDIIDQLSKEIRDDLGVFASTEESDSPVEEMTTNSPEAYKLYVDGLAAFRENNFAESELFLTRAVEIDSTFSQALLYLAMSQGWTESAPYHKARANLTILKRNIKGLNREETYIVDALYGIVFNDLELTLLTTGSLLKESPDNKWGHYFRAEALYHDGDDDYLEVLEPLENVLYLDPEFKMAYIHIFDVYSIEQIYDRGIVLANRFLQKFPDNYLGYYALGRFYNGNNESTLARRNYEKTIELNPKHRDASFDYLEFLISSGETDDAFELLQMMEKNESYSNALPRVWDAYADVYTAIEQYDKAYDAYEKSFGYATSDFQKGMTLREQAELDVLLGKVTTGISKMVKSRSLISEQDFNFGTLNKMIITLIIHGEYDMALSLTDSMNNYSISAEWKLYQGYLKGLIYLRSGNEKSAINIAADLQDLILNENRRIRNKHMLNVFNAEIHAAAGDYQKALGEYGHIPEDEGLLLKSELLRKLKHFQEALEVTEQMQKPGRFESFFEFPLAFYQRGLIYEDMGNADLAIKNYEKLLELWKDGDKKLPIRLDAQKRLSSLKKNM